MNLDRATKNSFNNDMKVDLTQGPYLQSALYEDSLGPYYLLMRAYYMDLHVTATHVKSL